MKTSSRLTPVLLAAAITGLAFALRVWALDQESLWFDTAHSAVVALNPTVGEVLDGAAKDFQSPLYFVLLHFWLNVSHSDFWLRLFTVLAGTAIIPLVYVTGQRLFSPAAGLWAALFSAITSYQVYYSRYPRSYILLALLAVLATYALYRVLHEGGKAWWALHGSSAALALYAHPYAFFVLPVLWYYALWVCATQDRRHWRGFVVTAGLVVVSYLPWAGIAIGQWGHVQSGMDAWIEPVSLESLKTLYGWLWFKTRGDYGPLIEAFLRASRYLFTALILVALWRGRRRPELWLTVGLVAGPAALAFLFSFAVLPLWDPRYLVVLSPFLALWLGYTMTGLGLSWQKLPALSRPLAAAALVAMNIPPLGSLYVDKSFWAPEIRSGSQWIREHYQDGDLILHLGYQSYLPALWYDHQSAQATTIGGQGYAVPCTWYSLPDAWCDSSPYRESYVNLELQDFSQSVAPERRIWLMLLYNQNRPDDEEKLRAHVEELRGQDFVVGRTVRFTGVNVFELVRSG